MLPECKSFGFVDSCILVCKGCVVAKRCFLRRMHNAILFLVGAYILI